MENVLNVAQYIYDEYKRETGEKIDELKLQKLIYFCQRESFAIKGVQLFNDSLEGWVHGPVSPIVRMYQMCIRDRYWIDGKKIYRKYINFNISSSSYDYTHNLNVAEYVKFDLKCTFSDGTIVSLPYVFFESENKWTNCLLITSLKANYIRFYNAWATGRIYGIIEYTKN